MDEAYEWWVNAEGEVLHHQDDQRRRGFSPLPDPREPVQTYGEIKLLRRCYTEEGDVLVPVRAERVPGALLWRWVYTGGDIVPFEDAMEVWHDGG